MSVLSHAAEALRSDPFFVHMDEDAQWEAARAQLAVEGVTDMDPLDIGAVVHMARQVRKAPGGARQGSPAAAVKAQVHGSTLVARFLEAAPFTHRDLAERLGVSRSLVTSYANDLAREIIRPSDAAALAALARETIAKLQGILPELDSRSKA